MIKLLNPSEKAKKYAQELRSKKRLCNDLTTIKNEPLTSNGASWRMGYLVARKDATEVWKANKEKFATVPAAKTNKEKRRGKSIRIFSFFFSFSYVFEFRKQS